MSDELDIERHEELRAYLERSDLIAAGEQPTFLTLRGGVSNRTVLVGRPGGESWVVKQALAKLRVATDWFSDPRRIEREAAALRWLAELAPAGTITPLVFEDRARHLLVMDAVPQPHDNWKELLLSGRLERRHVEQFGRLLGTIHRRADERRDEVARAFDDCSFFESLRIEPYYRYTATRVPAAAGFLEDLIEDTRRCRLTLVHGDYSPKNVLVRRDKLVLLDHEVVHFGDPAFDLGFALSHLLSKAHHLPVRRRDFASAAERYWQVYRETVDGVEWAERLGERAIRHALACLLARVDGRSPLEYLGEAERTAQRRAALSLLPEAPANVSDFVNRFIRRLEDHASH